MTTESHLAELERRHADLEKEISEVMTHPSADMAVITELKRRKLHIKDEIARLRDSQTLH